MSLGRAAAAEAIGTMLLLCRSATLPAPLKKAPKPTNIATGHR
jgi:hypothetical protein